MRTKEYPSWLVSVEVAKELKQIGFDEPAMFYLIDRSGQILLNPDNGGVDLCGVYSLEFEGILLSDYNDESFNVRGTTSIPSYEQVLKWFREREIMGSVIYNPYIELFDGEVMFWNNVLKVWRTITTCSREDYITARNEMILKMIECYRKYRPYLKSAENDTEKEENK